MSSRHLPRLAVAIGFSALLSACASTGAVPKPFPMPNPVSSEQDRSGELTEAASPLERPIGVAGAEPDWYALVGTALDLRGVRYRNGGAAPDGFDCSGFTQYVFARHGVTLPREVREQFTIGEHVRHDFAPGDLLFFTTAEPDVSHVAIAVGGDEFVHAPSSTGVVRVERLSASYWSQRFIGARRIRLP